MSRISTWFSSLAGLLLCGLLMVGAVDMAQAQNPAVAVSKDLCGPSGVCISAPNTSPRVLPTDVSVTKTATVTSTDPVTGAVTVHYVITIANIGPYDVHGFLLQDRLSVPSTGVPLIATYSGGTCSITVGSGTTSGPSNCFD